MLTRGKWTTVWAVSALTLALVAIPVYAATKCAACNKEAAELVKQVQGKSMTLTKAIDAAEKQSNGKAITAFTEKADKKIVFAVYCVVGDRVVIVEVDEAGSAGKPEDAENVPGIHDEKAHKPLPKPGG